MSNEFPISYPRDLALEQLVFAMMLHAEMQNPGYINEVLRLGVGAARINVEVDLAFSDMAATLRVKARRAGIAL
ncbi:MAG: hypothetical protein Q8L23_06340 [Caulobacter sp.]|nr:hypothetical protein [Caulobacter sp.]